MLRLFRKPAMNESATERLRSEAEERLSMKVPCIETELCFYVQLDDDLGSVALQTLNWLLGGVTLEPNLVAATLLEVGPRLNFETAWSTTAVAICQACGLKGVKRIERSIRFGISTKLDASQAEAFLDPLHDRMTQMAYHAPLQTFASGLSTKPVQIIPLLEKGKDALVAINQKLGLGWDAQDIDYVFDLFLGQLKRNPTDVELFQLAQANSEHSRHWFFTGNLVIDGQPRGQTLMKIIKRPWKTSPGNSIIAFADDSSAIKGQPGFVFVSTNPLGPSKFGLQRLTLHPTLTAETHNHPTGIAPGPGAETGTGGRIRDNQAVGRGGLVIAGGAAYCTANLHIPGHELPWENDGWVHPTKLASPLDIMIQASNGASDYGNCFGEPVIYGFARSCGVLLPDGYRAWFKPIMYTVGAGAIDSRHTKKGKPEKGMLVAQLGGPAYRIGLGGGAASSVVSGKRSEQLDFDSVQRGDPQMEQRMNRVIRACIELGKDNPIVSAHDLGAGGDCNALPEIVDPAGAIIDLRSIPSGDQSLSALELWGNESQERIVVLVNPDGYDTVEKLAQREGVPLAIVGRVTSDGMLIVHDASDGTQPVKLPLMQILGDLPPKTFELKRLTAARAPLELPQNLTVRQALDRVLRLVSVGSKRFLTTKVDRSVTGLVAQQQCVGPNQVTLSDYAIIALSYFEDHGVALSLGEQPMKGLISGVAMARLAVAEALLNMVGVKITRLEDIKASANWMLAAKLPGEGAWLVDAALSLSDICLKLGIAIDGGKDSLSMAAKTQAPDKSEQLVKAPGQLVFAAYAPMDDVNVHVTPEFKETGNAILRIDISEGRNRLDGSALAQVYQQVGTDCPDVEDVDLLKRVFVTIQELIDEGLVEAVHDCSDGGLVTCLLEMSFASNLGIDVRINQPSTNVLAALFSEEIGLVLETKSGAQVASRLAASSIQAQTIGTVGAQGGLINICFNGEQVLSEPLTDLRRIWEETSTAIDRQQANPICVEEEAVHNQTCISDPPYHLSFQPKPTLPAVLKAEQKVKVAILREQGSNGDREMAAAFHAAGFEPWDVTMTDLRQERISLDSFRGLVFVGGFSFADVLDAGRGWAGVIRFNHKLRQVFDRFYSRLDTFSLGVCNGCQLMALLGWVPWKNSSAQLKPRFVRNTSQRFESRFSTVKIYESPAIMLQGMEGSCLGVWVAHGEGRLQLPGQQGLESICDAGLAPIRFVDYKGDRTEKYPLNPNGSPRGITALCSPDGRHLAMMPHPERGFQLRQWPWLPKDWRKLEASPWLQMFQNAHRWCQET